MSLERFVDQTENEIFIEKRCPLTGKVDELIPAKWEIPMGGYSRFVPDWDKYWNDKKEEGVET
jgi:hypothetical protein